MIKRPRLYGRTSYKRVCIRRLTREVTYTEGIHCEGEWQSKMPIISIAELGRNVLNKMFQSRP